MDLNGPNVISIESSDRAEFKNIFSKIFWPFWQKLEKVEILGVGGFLRLIWHEKVDRRLNWSTTQIVPPPCFTISLPDA